MPDRKLLILTALRMEARAVARALGLSLARGGAAAAGSVGRFAVDLRTIGPRAALLDKAWVVGQVRDACFLIVAGLGGGLDPALLLGDVVIDWPWSVPLPALRPGWTVGRVHTSREVVGTVVGKAALFRATGALAVDMEQDVVRGLVRVPLVGIRAVSDTADQDVDPAVLRLVDDTGQPRPGAIAAYLARNPARVLHLQRLGKASRLALDRMGDAVWEIVTGPALAEAVGTQLRP